MLLGIAAVMVLLLIALIVMPKKGSDGGALATPSFSAPAFSQPVSPADRDKQLAAQMLDDVRLADAKEIVAGQMARAARGYTNPYGSQDASAAPSKATK